MWFNKGKNIRGFTLLEVIVAVSILAIAITVIFQIFSSNLRTVSQSEKYLMALMKAEELIGELSIQKELQETVNVTKTNDGQIVKTEIVKTLDERTTDLPVILYEIRVSVFWQQGNTEKSVILKTLRLMDKKV
ncbi:MAG: prepilin-type N-terminal cleavage/methylation domain-containing protein [Thermodesulfovibrionales bacterium]|nr:prepilin-type N-terminal cleavage/methylation domain-containing protein [Thermodesulfovibrionales bacterium]